MTTGSILASNLTIVINAINAFQDKTHLANIWLVDAVKAKDRCTFKWHDAKQTEFVSSKWVKRVRTDDHSTSWVKILHVKFSRVLFIKGRTKCGLKKSPNLSPHWLEQVVVSTALQPRRSFLVMCGYLCAALISRLANRLWCQFSDFAQINTSFLVEMKFFLFYNGKWPRQ